MKTQIESFLRTRQERFQSLMKEKGIDAAILVKPENVFYFSNFNPVLNSHPVFMLIPLEGEPCLLVHSIRYLHAQEEGGIRSIYCYGKWGNTPSLAPEANEAIHELLGEVEGAIGFEMESISVELYSGLLNTLHARSSVSVSRDISLLKMGKDEYEIGCIRRAARLVDCGVETVIRFLREGLSEAQASTEAQYSMRKLWHKEYPEFEVCGFGNSEGGMIDSLNVWSLSNEHIAYGCDCPRHYIPADGDISLPMAWAKMGGYHAENERTVLVGSVSGIRRKAYDAMLEARAAIFDILRPGIRFEELYFAAASVFSSHGFEDILPGRVGHGIGNSAHEFPSLARGNKLELAPGMAITVEPGLMDKNWGGARHSDSVLITETGYEILTQLDAGYLQI